MAFELWLTATPVMINGPVTQALEQAVDVSCFDQLDLALLAGDPSGTLSVELLTGMSNQTEDGWMVCATYPSVGAATARAELRTVRSPLRYLRWRASVQTGLASIQLHGQARTHRHTVFSPEDLPGLAFWLSAQEIVNVANNGSVARWQDGGPLGNDFVQSTTGAQPKFIRSGLNGNPGVRFDGVDDVLESLRGEALGDFTMFVLFRNTGGSPQSYERVLDKHYANGFWTGRDQTTASKWGGGVLNAAFPYGKFDTMTDGQPWILGLQRSGTTMNLCKNGAIVASDTVSSSATDSTQYRLAAAYAGGGLYAYGAVEIYEVMLYKSALSAAASKLVNDSLLAKWGLV